MEPELEDVLREVGIPETRYQTLASKGVTSLTRVRYLNDSDYETLGLNLGEFRHLQSLADARKDVESMPAPRVLQREILHATRKPSEEEVSMGQRSTLARDRFGSSDPRSMKLRHTSNVTKIDTVALQPDMYDAVVMAAFGGVVVKLPGSRGVVPLHPFLIFIFTLALFAVQYTLLTCLLLDVEVVDTGDHRWWVATWEEFDKMPGRRILLCSKIFMSLVLQMIVMKEFIACFRPLFFIINPYTWIETQRPKLQAFFGGNAGELVPGGHVDRTWFPLDAYHAFWCFPWCIASELFQFSIAYAVLCLSTSVILNCGKVSDVVLNGLAITFVLDLDEYAWAVLAPLLHIDERTYTDCDIEVLDEESAKNALAKFHETFLCGIFHVDGPASPDHWKIWIPKWFHRTDQGKVQLLENVLQVLILPVIFLRQVVVFVQAMREGVLPLSKEICELIEINKDHAYNWRFGMLDKLTPVNFSLAISNIQHREGFEHLYTEENCTKGEFRDLPFNFFPAFEENYTHCPYRKGMFVTVLVVAFVFILPQLLYGFWGPLQKQFRKCGPVRPSEYSALS